MTNHFRGHMKPGLYVPAFYQVTRIYEAIESVTSGARTKAEISGYVQAMDIHVTGPVI